MSDIDAKAMKCGPRISEVKAEVVAEHRPIWEAQHAQWKRERRCFWTRPIGHLWIDDPESPAYRVCEVCGKRVSSF